MVKLWLSVADGALPQPVGKVAREAVASSEMVMVSSASAMLSVAGARVRTALVAPAGMVTMLAAMLVPVGEVEWMARGERSVLPPLPSSSAMARCTWVCWDAGWES